MKKRKSLISILQKEHKQVILRKKLDRMHKKKELQKKKEADEENKTSDDNN